ncbi:hypothetical protein MBLNU13_g10371t1 [Cladosporium sp. NU13]
MTTRQCSDSKNLILLALWVTLNLMALMLFLRSSSLSTQLPTFSSGVVDPLDLKGTSVTMLKHPVKALFRKAEAEFSELLANQSTTFDMAASEYLRRYRRDPPPGFKIWYEYAVRHESVIIDEFDILNDALSPFWGLSGLEVKRALDHVRDSGPLISHCRPSDDIISAGCKPLGGELLRLLQEPELSQYLPEVDILINTLDEPRVLRGNGGGLARDREDTVLPDWTDFSHQEVWSEMTATCDRDSSFSVSRSPHSIRGSATTGPAFYTDKSDEVDLCRHPEYSTMHGIWRSPTNLLTTSSLVPILSPAVLSTMGDIPFPAAAYSNSAFTYDESEDMHWDNKTAGLYWAGSTTGSFQQAGDQGWKQDHRQRLVGVTNDLEHKPHMYLQRRRGSVTWERYNSSTLDQSLYNVHFTGIVQCADPTTEETVRAYFDIHDVEPRREAFRYTLTFDLDGNGHSGRFYRLLNSRSLPLKQTVFREWHDERLQPWQHYVPISLRVEDLPEVVRYLVNEEEGQQMAAQMAERGREWSLRALRPVDQAIYLFRLMIELSRLQDPSRSASR